MHSGGFELTKLTYTRLEDYLIRHRGDICTHMGTVRGCRNAEMFRRGCCCTAAATK